ncbi:MAG TPA: hypothetical protein VFO54_09260, partial [Chryseosolibacter sp.]|nr:hypothetical protein [Chryseosolibacter sp.]
MQPLQRILLLLEQRYDIVFAYADDNIAGIIINSPPENVNLTQALSVLQQSTGLLFRQLNKRFVTISRLEDSAKNICGTVSYGDTGELITGASVRAGRNATVTNEHGYFSLGEISLDSTLYISFIGYRTVAMPAREFAGGPCT